MRFVCSFVPAFFLSASCFAQGQTYQGELLSDDPRDFSQLTVELQPTISGVVAFERAFVSADGHFQLRNVAPGSYLIVIKDREGDIVYQQYSSIQGSAGFSIRLPVHRRQKPISGVVSVQELRHKPSKAARKAFLESFKRSQKGDVPGSVALLERAVEADPEFLQALNNLGTQYVRIGRYADAAQCFRRAIALGPKVPMLHANLAQAMLFLQDYSAAEASARTAITLNASDPIAPRAQLALGLAMAGLGKYGDARAVMTTCSQSADDVVRRAAEGFLARLH